jgi:ABC-type Zn uptake system ZnuABC Zn-binding protein ZnuA
MKKTMRLYCSIAAFLIMFAVGCATSTTAPLAVTSAAPATSTPAAPTVTAVANNTSSLLAKIADFNAGVNSVTPAQIQAHAANLQSQIAAFNAAAAPIANTLAGVATVAAGATGHKDVVNTIGLANAAIQAANAITSPTAPAVAPVIVAPTTP